MCPLKSTFSSICPHLPNEKVPFAQYAPIRQVISALSSSNMAPISSVTSVPSSVCLHSSSESALSSRKASLSLLDVS